MGMYVHKRLAVHVALGTPTRQLNARIVLLILVERFTPPPGAVHPPPPCHASASVTDIASMHHRISCSAVGGSSLTGSD